MGEVNLRGVSIEELTREINRRNDHPPAPLQYPDFSKLKAVVISGIKEMEETREPKDFEHYVFEAAMGAVYGLDIWEWYNKRIR